MNNTENNCPLYSDPQNQTLSADVLRQHELLKATLAVDVLLSVPNPAFIINQAREVVVFNKSLEGLVNECNLNKILGKRPGELLKCANASNNRCGESVACQQCGARSAIQSALSGETKAEECIILSEFAGMVKSYILKVTASPLTVNNEQLCIVHFTDISDSKNKEVVEKIFLHDLMNAVNGIVSAGTLLREETEKDSTKELAEMVIERGIFMANEINAHRLFISAENNELVVLPQRFSVKKTIADMIKLYTGNSLALNKNLTIRDEVEDFEIETDKRILYRILENLLKNALEASPQGSYVKISAESDEKLATFTVTNQGTIPITIAHQIFKRSFSTKGQGRGLGTYSVKMFAENYLGGKVWFDSSREEGTNFYVRLPLSYEGDPFDY